MKIPYSIKFLLHKRTSSAKTATLRMRFSMLGERFDIPMNIHVEVAKWDVIRQHMIGANKEAVAVNRQVGEWQSVVEETIAIYELVEKRLPGIEEIRQALTEKLVTRKNIQSPNDFYELLDKFIHSESMKNQWSKSTHDKFRNIKNHLKEFDNTLTFETINEDKMHEYLYWLHRRDYKNTTITKEISYIRWYLRWAAFRGYYNGNIHETFKPKLKGVDINSKEIIYLTMDELRTIETHIFPREYYGLTQVRDIFVFCCYTGLRYSDVANLRKGDIKGNYITVTTQKTTENIHIELNKHSRVILDKYINNTTSKQLVFPVISNAKMNEHLKRIGKYCGIDAPTKVVTFRGANRVEEIVPKWKLLTTHVGRRTFVVTALTLGIPAEVIMRWTGHNDFDAMKPYIKIVDELKVQSMSRFDNI